MRRDRQAELHFYEWRMTAWSMSETRDRLDATGRGIYRELLDCCYAQGVFPDDPQWICRRCACTREQLAEVWPTIERKFPKLDEGYRHNLHADIVRREYCAYVERQRENRKGKTKDFKDLHNGGKTTDEPPINGGGIANKPNGNGNGNGNVTATAMGGSPTPPAGIRVVTQKKPPHSDADTMQRIREGLRMYPGADRLPGMPDDEIVRKCLSLAGGDVDRLAKGLRGMVLAGKRPSTSWAYFPRVLAQYVEAAS